ncbi:MAG: hypothetical protein ACFFD2_12180 [Promethearchaeota archaeon]
MARQNVTNMQFKFIYTNGKTGKKIIVTSYEQLSKLCDLGARTISKHLKESDIFYDSKGEFIIERAEYQKDKAKRRKNNLRNLK